MGCQLTPTFEHLKDIILSCNFKTDLKQPVRCFTVCYVTKKENMYFAVKTTKSSLFRNISMTGFPSLYYGRLNQLDVSIIIPHHILKSSPALKAMGI